MPFAPSPSHHHLEIGGINLPFPVMGGKNDIVLPTLYHQIFNIECPASKLFVYIHLGVATYPDSKTHNTAKAVAPCLCLCFDLMPSRSLPIKKGQQKHHPFAPCMDYLHCIPTFESFWGVDVGKYPSTMGHVGTWAQLLSRSSWELLQEPPINWEKETWFLSILTSSP